MTEALVNYFPPEQVYLIGSTGRGEAGPDSDIDFLVVVPDDTPRHMCWQVHSNLPRTGFNVDVVPFRRTEFDRRSGWLMSMPAIARREGKLLYEAAVTV